MDRFVAGDTVTLRNLFKVASVLTDPTTISLTVTTPAYESTTYTYAAAEITKNGTGDYQRQVTASTAGIWRYKWTGTGSAADVQDGSFTVSAAADITTYCTVEELKDEIGGATATTEDAKLQRAINAASRQIDGYCGQRFYMDLSLTTRYFTAEDGIVDLSDYDFGGIATTTGLIVATDDADTLTYGTTWATTDYRLLPLSAAADGAPYTQLGTSPVGVYSWPVTAGSVKITAKFGWPTVPADVNKACLIQAGQLYKAKDAAFGIASFGAEGAGMRVTGSINPIAKGLLAAYRKPAVG